MQGKVSDWISRQPGNWAERGMVGHAVLHTNRLLARTG